MIEREIITIVDPEIMKEIMIADPQIEVGTVTETTTGVTLIRIES